MELNKNEIINIINSNVLDNLICRALESRPGVLSKYICGLANKEGGYVFIGVEKDNGVLKTVGFQLAFDMSNIMISVCKKLSGNFKSVYGYISVSGLNIFAIRVEKAEQRIYVDNTCYLYKSNGVEIIVSEELNKPSTLFISYTECDAPIVDIIEKIIRSKLKDEIKISRYTKLEYKDSFKEFMDTIQDHEFVITVVSDTYLKKQACMYEVGETLKNHHYKDKLLFVVLSENERKYYGENAPKKIGADIYNGALAKLEYIGFWKKQYEMLQKSMKQIGDYEAISETTKDLQIIGQIYRKDMGEFLKFLSDENGQSFQKLYDDGFEDIVQWINLGKDYSKKNNVFI